MKRSIWTRGMLGAVLGAIGPGIAMADNCIDTSGTDGRCVLSMRPSCKHSWSAALACTPALGPPWTNQQYLSGGTVGTIMDYKMGPPRPGNSDPTTQVGGYSIDAGNGGEIAYTYSGTRTFTYTVWGTQTGGSGTYDFCAGKIPLPGRVKIIVGTNAPRSCASAPWPAFLTLLRDDGAGRCRANQVFAPPPIPGVLARGRKPVGASRTKPAPAV